MTTRTTPAVGQNYTSTETRPYTEHGVRRTHTRTTQWEIVESDGEFLSAAAVGIVNETGRPFFAGYPQTSTLLLTSYIHRLTTGEIKEA